MHARSWPFGQVAGDCATGGGHSCAAVRSHSWPAMRRSAPLRSRTFARRLVSYIRPLAPTSC
nr:MAG TPA: hypothetical protein [Caudoviricetes sp.]